MTGLHFIIPGRPTAWQRTATTKGGRRITPKAMKDAQGVIAKIGQLAMRGRALPVGPLRLEVLAVYAVPPSWMPAKREAALLGKVWKTSVPDWDNLAKQVGDALNGVAYRDDAQIVVASVAKRFGRPERTEVRLTPIDGLGDGSPNAAFKAMASDARGQTRLALPSSNECNSLTRESGEGA